MILILRIKTLDKGNRIVYIWLAPNIVGVFNGEGPPVPIPNTEVKLTSADNTCLETDWKDRSTPTQRLRRDDKMHLSVFLLFPKITARFYAIL